RRCGRRDHQRGSGSCGRNRYGRRFRRHLEPGAGHYGIFAGSGWRNNIRPLVLNFIDENQRKPAKNTVNKNAAV
ncbi:MAG: hypothetical protein ACPG5U_07395, partial [Planktomarina sp.]